MPLIHFMPYKQQCARRRCLAHDYLIELIFFIFLFILFLFLGVVGDASVDKQIVPAHQLTDITLIDTLLVVGRQYFLEEGIKLFIGLVLLQVKGSRIASSTLPRGTSSSVV